MRFFPGANSRSGLTVQRGCSLAQISPRVAFPLLCGLLVLTSCTPASAQITGQIDKRPIGVGYMRDMSQVTVMKYLQTLSERLSIGASMMEQIRQTPVNELQTGADKPLMGVSWYLVKGLVPSFEAVYFQEVVDESDARRYLQARKKMMGDQGNLEIDGDGRYKVVMANTSSWEPPRGVDAEAQVKSINQLNTGSRQFSARVIEKDGKKMIEQSWSFIEYYRLQENLLFSAQFEELWDMELPARESLPSRISSRNDLGMEAFFDRIPLGIKTLGWNMLNASVGTQMQRRDEEEQTIADLRKSSLTSGVEILRSVMFDVQQTNGSIRFASDESPDIVARIMFEARKNSGLTKQLSDMSSSVSRFGPILNDESALTLHTCFRLSEDAAQIPRDAAAWIVHQASIIPEINDNMEGPIKHLASFVGAYGDDPHVELLVKAGWTEDTGGVIYGGMSVPNDAGLLDTFVAAFTNADIPSAAKQAVGVSELDGRTLLTVSLPEGPIREMREATGLQISHVFLTHEGSRLWFAAG